MGVGGRVGGVSGRVGQGRQGCVAVGRGGWRWVEVGGGGWVGGTIHNDSVTRNICNMDTIHCWIPHI